MDRRFRRRACLGSRAPRNDIRTFAVYFGDVSQFLEMPQMRQSLRVAVFALFAVSCCASAQTEPQESETRRLQGTWKLLSYVGEEVPSGTRADVMGPYPSGYINYGPDGRMIVIIVGTGRSKPAGSVATPEEAEALPCRISSDRTHPISWDGYHLIS